MASQQSARFSRGNPQEQQKSQSQTEWMRHTVEDQPMTAMCAAFAAGFLVGAAAVTAYCAAESQANRRDFDHFSTRFAEAISRMPRQVSEALHRG